MIFGWQRGLWDALFARADTMPHALLIAGPAGAGKSELAQAIAQRLLCERASGQQEACGECDACRWFAAGNHPDYRFVAPGSDELDDAPGEGEEAAEPGKRPTQIRVEQIRALADFANIGAVRAGARVVVIDPAEAMNHHTANALLKLLEEPPSRVQFVLVSDAPRRLLPTILSRCRQVPHPRPTAEEAQAWLAEQGVDDAAALLALCGGMPVAAAELAAASGGAMRERFVRDLRSLDQRADPVALAAAWETWLKSKDVLASGVGLPHIVLWLQRWIADLAGMALAGRVRFFPDQAKTLAELAARVPVPLLLSCYNEFHQLRRVVNHPLNLRLYLDDMLLRYARLVAR